MNYYEVFSQLHRQAKPLVIANAWNVKSAQTIEQNGYDAIATSSGAIANSLGYADGEKIRFSDLLYIIQRIKSCTIIPLSVDMERGYTDDPGELIENIQRLIDVGVAGINLEDSQGEEIYLKKLRCIKDHLIKTSQELFINARTDAFLLKLQSPLQTTLRRAKLYQEEGADGLFVTAISDCSIIKEIASSTSLPLNVVGSPTLSSIKTLSECGVRRISMAVYLYKATYHHLEKLVREIKLEQSFTSLF